MGSGYGLCSILKECPGILGTIIGLDALDRSFFLIFHEINDFKCFLDDFCFGFQESDFTPARLIINKFEKYFALPSDSVRNGPHESV
jgi:hypothetical protein